ncbi:MAG: hypothetical protein ACJ0DJ_09900 [bacterium]
MTKIPGKNQEEWDLGREIKVSVPANADPAAVEAGAYGPATKREIIDERLDWNEEMDELKEIVWDWIEEPLVVQDSQFLNRGRLIRLAGEIEQFSLQEDMANDFREQISKWAENEDIAIDLRELLGASREKVKLYDFPATKPPVPTEEKYAGISKAPLNFPRDSSRCSAAAATRHGSKAVLIRGCLKQLTWLLLRLEKRTSELLKREIMLENVTYALQNGLLVNTNGSDSTCCYSHRKCTFREIELRPLLKMVGALFPSLKAQNRKPRDLFETLVDRSKYRGRLIAASTVP